MSFAKSDLQKSSWATICSIFNQPNHKNKMFAKYVSAKPQIS